MKSYTFTKDNAFFMIPYGAGLVGVGIYQLLYKQAVISLAINRSHTSFSDSFFKYFTHIGDGFFCIALGIVLYFYQKRLGLAVLASYALSGIVAQLLKNFIFSDQPRPAEYFSKMMKAIHTVEGVALSHWHSFPSGHTTSAFAVFGLLSFYTTNSALKILCLLVAILVGFSRVYLFQHFLIDVYAGSILGVIVAVGVRYYMQAKYDDWQ